MKKQLVAMFGMAGVFLMAVYLFKADRPIHAREVPLPQTYISTDDEQQNIGRSLSELGTKVKDGSLADLVSRTLPSEFDDYCEDVFTSEEYMGYDFTEEYKTGFPELEKKIKSIKSATWEGSSGTLREQSLMLHFLARGPDVKTVCETGFNVGYSSFAYLSANSNVKVHSFDLGRHKGTKPMVQYLKSIYGERLQIHYGDSTKVLPEFHEQNPDVKCDVILVDGGHSGAVPWIDIQNFATMFAVPGKSVMMFDDYPTHWGIIGGHRVLGQSWELARHYKLVKELLRCTFKEKLFQKWERGFVVGMVASTNDLKIKHKW